MTAQAVEMMVEDPIESATVVRTFVVMGSVATKAVRSMGAPILLFVALGLAVATVGNVTVFPLLGRTRRLTGVVSRFDDESGHGFVVGDADGKTVFVHGETLRRRYRRLNPGQRVSYRLIKGSRRDFAVSLTVLEEG